LWSKATLFRAVPMMTRSTWQRRVAEGERLQPPFAAAARQRQSERYRP